jgi:hypothetical protein
MCRDDFLEYLLWERRSPRKFLETWAEPTKLMAERVTHSTRVLELYK